MQVTDQGGLSFTKTLTINVVDVNERPTDELLSANTVLVDAPNGTVIGTVTSIDPDVGKDVLTRYTIVDSAGNPVVGGPFAIDAATGVMTVADNSSLPRRTRSSCGRPTRVCSPSTRPSSLTSPV
jgi:hypothetical protein